MDSPIGTPTTLKQAILQALIAEDVKAGAERINQITIAIEDRVLDFLRQHFTVAYLVLSEDIKDESCLAAIEALAQAIGVKVKELKDGTQT